jgi:methylmalonyl-CoA mutase cobalamin-binding domain/chain
MRDNGIPYAQDAQVEGGLDTFAGLAQEALNQLVSLRGTASAAVRAEHLDYLIRVVARIGDFDPAALLQDMAARRLDAETVACHYVPAAARLLGERWLADEVSFVDVTVGTERLHELVRRVDEILDHGNGSIGPSALILVAEAEQHTLGAFVVALHLRSAGFSATVRVAPRAAELGQLMSESRYELAVVSLGCSAALESGVGLVRTLRRLSRGDLCIFVGGSIPVEDARLLAETGADRVLRDVSALVAEYRDFRSDRALEGNDTKALRLRRNSAAKGDGVEA